MNYENLFSSTIKFSTTLHSSFCEVWKIRKTLDTPIREENEYDFLPAHLELMKSPFQHYLTGPPA